MLNPGTKVNTVYGLRNFAKNIFMVEFAAISGLLFAGAILTWVEKAHRYPQTFFTYRIEHLDYLPAWFVATLLLSAINGFYMFRLSTIEGVLNTPGSTGWGEWGVYLPMNPLRLFAINLIAIPLALALFIIIRANSW